MPHLNRPFGFSPQPEPDPTPSTFTPYDELPAPHIFRGGDYKPDDGDPLDLWEGFDGALILACDMELNYGANGSLSVTLKTGEKFNAYWAYLASRGWMRLQFAKWLNGPPQLRKVRREVLIYRANVLAAKWNWPDGLRVEGGQ